MLSIVICHRSPELLEQLKTNVQASIGIDYEVIAIDNRLGRFGICEAYNLGAEQARFPYLCFIHEDILFHTQAWGKILLKHFQNPKIGLIGIAGTSFYGSKIGNYASVNFGAQHLIQHFRNNPPMHVEDYPGATNVLNAVCIDGVLMACPKTVWEQTGFDQTTFTGFHAYDTDFSFSVVQKFDVLVIRDILIEHFSQGNFDQKFLAAHEILINKWKDKLPIFSSDFDKQKIQLAEWRLFLTYCHKKRKVNGYFSVFKEAIHLFKKYPNPFWFVLVCFPWPLKLYDRILYQLKSKP
jgi:glycosyltransferase involved in cell wall biosynthesis